ncbi:hypothetical protein C7M84_011352 [Penaeus vannamei]|uniref:Uncharacterized protein n=1 Tax=Penaeus vannamei TaxID=6689 RepID=A0A3R7PFT4_PENVA|nr:hypothetical protein C7M84_011352 [Penaeus vannamei]
MYSREDIREQYCINDKELHALEASRRKPIFGCLTSGNTQVSPCKKKSLLPACLRGRVPSDENVYTKTSSAAPSAHASPAHRKHQHEHDQIDYEDDSYFKRRPKTICYTDPKRLASFDDSLARSSRVSRPRSEVGSATYDSYHADDVESDAARRPTQLAITSGDHHSTEFYHGDSHKEGYPLTRSAFTQPNTPDLSRHSSRHRQVTTPALFPLEDRPQKHVSFQKAMSRSATVAVLEEQVMSRQDSGRASVKSGGSRSHERLLDGRRTPDYMEQRALDQLLAPSGGGKHRKGQAREVTRRSGGLTVESEAGSRSRSRTPSLRRKKVEKKTVGVQTDEMFEMEVEEERMKVGRGPGVLEEAREGARGLGVPEEGTYGVGGRRQKKTKKKAITIVEPPDVFSKREDPPPPARQRKEEAEASPREVAAENKKPKKTKSKSGKAKAKDGAPSEAVPAPKGKAVERQEQRPSRRPEEVPLSPVAPRIEKSVKDKGSKVSMAMQTDDAVETIFSDRSIFLTDDLDTSTDWREESSIDWQTSASSLAWQTDRSSFAWQTDASSGNKYTGDNSFALESCEEQENNEDLLNMDVFLIRDRRNKECSRQNMNQNAAQESENETNQNVQWDGGGPRSRDPVDGKAQRKVAAKEVKHKGKTQHSDKEDIEGKQRLGEEKNSRIGRTEKESKKRDGPQTSCKPPVLRPPNDNDDEVAEIHEEFRKNSNNGKEGLQMGDKVIERGILKEQIEQEEENEEMQQEMQMDDETNAMVRRLRFRRQMAEEFLNQQAEDLGKAREQASREPESRGHNNLAATLPNRRNQKLRFAREVVTPEKQLCTQESYGTWPQRVTENQRTDDINLKAFPAFSPSAASGGRKSRNQAPEHKRSHLEINLVIRDKDENPKNTFTNEHEGKTSISRPSTAKPQQVETSDEYPRSDHDYGGSRLKKIAPKSDPSRTPQRKKKTGVRELIEPTASNKTGNIEHEVQPRLPPKNQGERGINRLTYIRDEEKQQCYCTDTSSTVTNTDSVGRRVRRIKKKALAVQTEEATVDSQRAQEETKVEVEGKGDRAREITALGSNPTVAEEHKESGASQPEVTSLRRKRSVKRRSRCIQADLSLEDQIEAISSQENSQLPYSSERFNPSVPTDVGQFKGNVEIDAGRSDQEKLEAQAPKDDKEQRSGTMSSSIRRMKKVRKTVATTQTEEKAELEDGLFIPPAFQPDSVSIRTSSLRRIRRAQKATVAVQTDDVIPVCFDNLHLSLLDFKGGQPLAESLGPPRHSDSLIYMNIPAALLEVVESGNDADVSDSEEGDGDAQNKDSEDEDFRIYNKVTEEDFNTTSHVITRLSPGDVTVKISSRRSSYTEAYKGHDESVCLLPCESGVEEGVEGPQESEGAEEAEDTEDEAKRGKMYREQLLKNENSRECKNVEEDESQTGREEAKGKTRDISESRKKDITWRESLARDGDEEKTGSPKDGWMWQQVNDEETESSGTTDNELAVGVAQGTETDKSRRERETKNRELKKAKSQKDDKPDILKELYVDKKKDELIPDVEMANKTHAIKKEEIEKDGGIKKEKRTRIRQATAREKEVDPRGREEGEVREKVKNIPDVESGRTKVEKESMNRKEGGEIGKNEENEEKNEAEVQKPGEGEMLKEKSGMKAVVEDKERKIPNEEKAASHTEGQGDAPEREAKGTREMDEGRRGTRGRRVLTPRQKFSEKRSRHEKGDFSLTDDAQVRITDPAASPGPVVKEAADGNAVSAKDNRPSGGKPVVGDMKRDNKNSASPVHLEEACTESEVQISTRIADKPAAMREDGAETNAVVPIANFSEPEAETKSDGLEMNSHPQGELDEGMGKQEPEFEESSEVNVSTKEEDENENDDMTQFKTNKDAEREVENIQEEDTKKKTINEDHSDEGEAKMKATKAKMEVETIDELEKSESCMADEDDGEQLKITGKEEARDILDGKEVTEETLADPELTDNEDWEERSETTSNRKEEGDLLPLNLTEGSRDTFAEDDDECIVITYRPPQKPVQRGRPREGAGVRGEADGADRSPSASRRTDDQGDDGKDVSSKEGEEAKKKKTRRSKRKKVKDGIDANKKEGEETHVTDIENVSLKGEDKKKKRPRQRKNKAGKEKVPQTEIKEASKMGVQEGESRAADQESKSSAHPPTRRWAEEVEEEGLDEWGEGKKGEVNEGKDNRGEKRAGDASRVAERNPLPEVKAGEAGATLAVEEDFLTESDALETEEDTSYYEEEGEGSSRYEMESEEGGEGGGEQNAFEEYLLLREDEGIEEMQTVDRIFRQVFEDYNDGEFLGEGDVSEGECNDSLHFLGSGRGREEEAQGKSKTFTGVRVEGDELEVESKNDLDVQSSRTSVPPGAEVMQARLSASLPLLTNPSFPLSLSADNPLQLPANKISSPATPSYDPPNSQSLPPPLLPKFPLSLPANKAPSPSN